MNGAFVAAHPWLEILDATSAASARSLAATAGHNLNEHITSKLEPLLPLYAASKERGLQAPEHKQMAEAIGAISRLPVRRISAI